MLVYLHHCIPTQKSTVCVCVHMRVCMYLCMYVCIYIYTQMFQIKVIDLLVRYFSVMYLSCLSVYMQTLENYTEFNYILY